MAAATPSNSRLKLTPSNSPYLGRPARSPMRGRGQESWLSLRRVVGTTCRSQTGFDTLNSSFAYVAGGAVVVVTVENGNYTQRFYRARPAAIPIYNAANALQNSSSTPTLATPKANDSRGRVAPSTRDSIYGSLDWTDSPTSKTWTSRERIKAATCVALSRDGKFLAVGETGYAPRVLIFNLQEASSDTPLVSINEHTFGVNAVAWSADSRYLASLGAANDGFLYIWKVDPRTGQTKLFQQNRCTSYIRHMTWMGSNLITLGVRHVKIWKIEDGPSSPTKTRHLNDSAPSTPTSSQKTLPGRNVLLGGLLDATFTCAAVDGNRLLVCTEAGDVCIMDDDDRQMKLAKAVTLNFAITTITIRGDVAYVGGKDGSFATLDVLAVMDAGGENCVLSAATAPTGMLALGFLNDNLVTIDSKQSIDVWSRDHLPGQKQDAIAHIPIPGHGESIDGIHPLRRPNKPNASFITWSGSGNVTFWDTEGRQKMSVDVPIDAVEIDSEMGVSNQVTCVETLRNGKQLIIGDRLGILKIFDVDTKELLLDTKAHSMYCVGISVCETPHKFVVASCGRDRTVQLFHQLSNGTIEHFQTLEFNARVVQVLIPSDDKVITCSLDRSMQIHDLVTREGEPDVIAAIPSKVISLKASPTSLLMGPDRRSIYVSLLDRSVFQFDLFTGRQVSCFKCTDEGGVESAVLDDLTLGNWPARDLDFILGTSNTDKSIRLYDARSGTFLDLEDDDGSKKVISAASDGTIMIWLLDFTECSPRSMSRDPSPAKEGRPTLRKVLSRAELAEFQRPSPSNGRQKSPPRTLPRRSSRINLKTPTGTLNVQGNSTILESTPSRRRPSESQGASPPPSPKGRISRRPSLPAMSAVARKKTSATNLRAQNTLNTATEQACRTLRLYRRKLSSAEPITAECLTELDQELRLTAAALGDRAIRSKAMNETVLSGLLDQYSERLVTLLDEKLRLTTPTKDRETDNSTEERRGSASSSSNTSSSP
ncbi:WD domain containing [Cordyceps militaris]|uniref:WD domain containing n=1 Tax=Cordyceps militaris TaxID=73501 RepID=A0A2H4S7R3_CORMI|nr:WD domain containing [Cordyceps militaris]